MNISSARFYNLSTKPTLSTNDESLEHVKKAKESVAYLTSTDALNKDKVNISQQAFSQLSLNKQKTDQADVASTSPIDRALDNIKKQLEKLKQEFDKIKFDKTEAAKVQRNAIQRQINALNASLLDLLGKKLNSLNV